MNHTLREFLESIKSKHTYLLFRYTDEAYKLRRCYRPVILKKKNGGFRVLQVPDENLKRLQRQLLTYLQHAEISPCAAAYVKGRGLSEHAHYHAGRSMLLKLDIEDFFGSISFSKVLFAVKEALKRSPLVGQEQRSEIGWFIAKACTLDGVLPQGAPTSPILSNMVFLHLDQEINSYCIQRGIHYTRYSDDLFFSGDFRPSEIIPLIRKLLRRNGYTLNENKIVAAGRGSKKLVTGVVVNQRPQADRSYRREIRQSIYYIGKFGLEEHLKRKGLLDEGMQPEDMRSEAAGNEDFGREDVIIRAQMVKELQRLIGRIVFVLQIDPQNREFQDYKKFCIGLLNRLPVIFNGRLLSEAEINEGWGSA
ncbi:reverse transcriptase family protein [Anoxybacterium hadale]|uniref:reverse transcriptase family protein n=1 Tax=Anoxybacterium hadale TaxID=3408580 RepID=UPI003B008BDF